MRRLFDNDPVTRTTQNFHVEDDDSFIIEAKQDVTDIAEMTQAEFREASRNFRKGNFHKVGSIPLNIVADLQKQGIWQDDAALMQWLENPDNRKWKTKDVKLA